VVVVVVVLVFVVVAVIVEETLSVMASFVVVGSLFETKGLPALEHLAEFDSGFEPY